MRDSGEGKGERWLWHKGHRLSRRGKYKCDQGGGGRHDGLKHFYSGLDGRTTTRPRRNDSDDSCSSEGRVNGKKAKVSRSFSGWLSDIITGRAASPLVVVVLPLVSLRAAGKRNFPLPPCIFRLVALSLFFPSPPRDCGANTPRYRINFLSRGCRDFTPLLERRAGATES